MAARHKGARKEVANQLTQVVRVWVAISLLPKAVVSRAPAVALLRADISLVSQVVADPPLPMALLRVALHRVGISRVNKAVEDRRPLTALLRMAADPLARLKVATSPVNKAARPKLAANPRLRMEAGQVIRVVVNPFQVVK